MPKPPESSRPEPRRSGDHGRPRGAAGGHGHDSGSSDGARGSGHGNRHGAARAPGDSRESHRGSERTGSPSRDHADRTTRADHPARPAHPARADRATPSDQPGRTDHPARTRPRRQRRPRRDLPRTWRPFTAEQLAQRAAAIPVITYPDLPVSARRHDIAEAIRDNQVVIVSGETGSGKTTQLPKICLQLGRGVAGMIGHTQPRRLAAHSVAERIAEELGQTVGRAPGQVVGYQVRFTDEVGPTTLVKLMTDGILLAEIQSDPLLHRYDTLIIDEAHERSLNIDFILGYIARLLPLRPDLKVVITSATIDSERFAAHFGRWEGRRGRGRLIAPAPVVEVSGRTYPVEIRYRPLSADVAHSWSTSSGDVPPGAHEGGRTTGTDGGQAQTHQAQTHQTHPTHPTGADDPDAPSAHAPTPAPTAPDGGRIRFQQLVLEDPDDDLPSLGYGLGEDIDQEQGICDAVDELCAEGPGDILVFLPGERDIRDTQQALTDHLGPRALTDPKAPHGPDAVEIIPLYARLTAAEQHRVFEAHPTRRVVLATNVAETSLTVPGVRFVIDPGLARISRYSNRTKVQRLPIEPISQASANQRAGRCGRVADGIAIRLYSQRDYESRPEFTEPEILRTSLASVILQMAALGLGAVADFPFLDPPDPRAVRDGVQLLVEIGALEEDRAHPGGHALTATGRDLAALPIDPRLGRMLIEGDDNGCASEVLVIVAALSIQDVRERPLEHQQAADAAHARFTDRTSDFITYLNLWRYLNVQSRDLTGSAFRRMCRGEFLHYLRFREWRDVVNQLRQMARPLDLDIHPIGEPTSAQVVHAATTGGIADAAARAVVAFTDSANTVDADEIHRSLLVGLLSNLGNWDEAKRDYAGARGTHFTVWPGSGLAHSHPAWVMAAELVETSRLFARTVARIRPEWIEPVAAPLLRRVYSEPYWSSSHGAAMVKEKVLLYGMTLVADRPVMLGRLDVTFGGAGPQRSTVALPGTLAGIAQGLRGGAEREVGGSTALADALSSALAALGIDEDGSVATPGGPRAGSGGGVVAGAAAPATGTASADGAGARAGGDPTGGGEPAGGGESEGSGRSVGGGTPESRGASEDGGQSAGGAPADEGAPADDRTDSVDDGSVTARELAREMFIRHALVAGEWREHPPFQRRNEELLEQAREVERRSRTHGLVADEQVRYAFFDDLVPDDVVSAGHFNRWWKRVRRETPDLLTYTPGLLLPRGTGTDPAEFPDHWVADGVRLPLSYRFDPGSSRDGVTMTVPVEVLPRVSEDGTDWLVPGMLEELVTETIRALPKARRRLLAPAPEVGAQVARRLRATYPDPALRGPDDADSSVGTVGAEVVGGGDVGGGVVGPGRGPADAGAAHAGRGAGRTAGGDGAGPGTDVGRSALHGGGVDLTGTGEEAQAQGPAVPPAPAPTNRGTAAGATVPDGTDPRTLDAAMDRLAAWGARTGRAVRRSASAPAVGHGVDPGTTGISSTSAGTSNTGATRTSGGPTRTPGTAGTSTSSTSPGIAGTNTGVTGTNTGTSDAATADTKGGPTSASGTPRSSGGAAGRVGATAPPSSPTGPDPSLPRTRPPFADAFARAIREVRGVDLSAADLRHAADHLPEHLRMTFVVVDRQRHELGSGPSLTHLQRTLASQADKAVRTAVRGAIAEAFADAARGGRNRDRAETASSGPDRATRGGGATSAPGHGTGGGPGGATGPTAPGAPAATVAITEGDLHVDGLTAFPPHPLPRSIESRDRTGLVLRGHPALVPQGDATHPSAGVRVMANPAEADRLHRLGLARLLLVRVALATARVTTRWTGREALMLAASPYGGTPALVADAQLASALALVDDLSGPAGPSSVRDAETFERLASRARDLHEDLVHDILGHVVRAMEAYSEVEGAMRDHPEPSLREVVDDVGSNVRALVHPGFLADTPAWALPHLARYLRGGAVRLARASQGAAALRRDAHDAAVVHEVEDAVDDAIASTAERPFDAVLGRRLDEARWMVQELRVSLFAQQLGTPQKVSAKRILGMVRS